MSIPVSYIRINEAGVTIERTLKVGFYLFHIGRESISSLNLS